MRTETEIRSLLINLEHIKTKYKKSKKKLKEINTAIQVIRWVLNEQNLELIEI